MSDEFEDMTGDWCRDCGSGTFGCVDCATEPLRARIAELEGRLAACDDTTQVMSSAGIVSVVRSVYRQQGGL